MRYKIIDKKTKKSVINYSFQAWNGSKTENAQFISLSDNDALLFSSKQDAESTAKRLGNKYIVVEVTEYDYSSIQRYNNRCMIVAKD